MTKQRKAMLMMVITACLWSIGGIFLKLVSWNAFLITGSRSLLAAGVLGGYMYFSKTKFKINKYSIAAAVSLAGLLFCFVAANKLTTAANAIILQYTAPIFILIISILFLKHQVHKKEVIIVTVTALGIVFFFFDQLSPGNIIGNMLAILAGFLLAIMFLAVGFGGGEDDSIRLSSMLIGHLLTAVIGIPIGIPLTESFATSEIICIVILGIVQLGIPYVLYALASKDCSPLACSLIGMIEPILNPVWVFIFAGEMPGFYALVGGAIVIAAVTTWCVIGEKEG
jgi:drug/metabolite transporter (DMT)-like permease